MTARRAESTARWLVGLVLAALVVLFARVAQLQLAPSEALRASMPDRVAFRVEEGQRGELVDRRGRQLATSRVGERIIIDPVVLPSPPDDAILALAEALAVEPFEVGEPILRALAENDRRRALLPQPDKRAPDGVLGVWRAIERFVARADASGDAGQAPAPGLPSDYPKPLSVTAVTESGEVAAGQAPVASDHEAEPEKPKRLIRYLPLTPVLEPAVAERVRRLGIDGVHIERRFVREYPGGDAVASLVGKVGFEHRGLLGAELTFDEALSGQNGRAAYVRDAWGRPLWIEAARQVAPRDGTPTPLSIDLQVQQIAIEELRRGMEEADAAGGRIVVADPRTGEVLALADLYREVPGLRDFPWEPVGTPRSAPRAAIPTVLDGVRYRVIPPDPRREEHPALGRNRCVEDVYEPGSTFKPFVWTLVTQAGLAHPDEVIDTEGGRWLTPYGRPIEDVTKRPEMTWREVLINSSNIGLVKKGALLGHDRLRDGVRSYGFGTPTGLGLPGEAVGLVTSRKAWSEYTQTSVSFGNEVAVTPVQMVRAFSAIARSGELAGTLPRLRLTADDSGAIVHRVVEREVAELARHTLRPVAEKVEQRMLDRGEAPEGGWRWPMFGKSGTAEIPLTTPPKGLRRPRGARGYYTDQYNSSFIAGAPLEAPAIVVLVVIDDPGPDRVRARTHYGSAVAGPVVRRVVERTLEYLGEPLTEPDRALVAR